MRASVNLNGHAGKVTDIRGNYATVEFIRSDACGHCNACLTLSDGIMQTQVKNTLHAQKGDTVVVVMEAKRIVTATLLGYGVPLAMLIAGMILGGLISETVSFFTGIAACLLSYLLLHKLEPRFAANEGYQPKMLRILAKNDDE